MQATGAGQDAAYGCRSGYRLQMQLRKQATCGACYNVVYRCRLGYRLQVQVRMQATGAG